MAAKPYPELGVPFKLTLDGDAPENQPLAMVANAGYDPISWKHNGSTVKGRQTRSFMLVQKGGTWDEIGTVTGNDVEGQWCNAFKAEYPDDDKVPVGVHDKSWTAQSGSADFPCVHTDGTPGFCGADNFFVYSWRWLVPAK